MANEWSSTSDRPYSEEKCQIVSTLPQKRKQLFLRRKDRCLAPLFVHGDSSLWGEVPEAQPSPLHSLAALIEEKCMVVDFLQKTTKIGETFNRQPSGSHGEIAL